MQGGSYDSNASFKGYAEKVSGATWTTDPGNSASSKPARILSYISVMVATHLTVVMPPPRRVAWAGAASPPGRYVGRQRYLVAQQFCIVYG